MEKLTNMYVKILKMRESSGNEQVFVRLVRNDVPKKSFCNAGILEHSCWQTKHLDKEECLKRAWFDASYLIKFVGSTTMDDVVIVGCDEDETAILKSSLALALGVD